jgi:hypothetical protein
LLRNSFCGFGGLALLSLLHEERLRAAPADPLAPKKPHTEAKAKSVIFLFMAGGPSHLDTFDPKPLLNKLNGQARPAEFGEAKYQFIKPDAKLLGSARKFSKHGKAGIDVSDLFPHVATCAADVAVVRSCHGDMVVHSAAVRAVHQACRAGFPAWARGSSTASAPRADRCRPTSSCRPRRRASRTADAPTACPRCISRRCSAAVRIRCAPRPAVGNHPEQRRATARLIGG